MLVSAAARSLILCLVAPLPAVSGRVLRVDDDAAPGGDGSSWASAIDDLQIALGAAQAGDEIWVAEGRYRPSASDPNSSFFLPDGVALYGGFAGTETDRDARDPAAHVALLDGDLAGDDLPGFQNTAENSLHV